MQPRKCPIVSGLLVIQEFLRSIHKSLLERYLFVRRQVTRRISAREEGDARVHAGVTTHGVDFSLTYGPITEATCAHISWKFRLKDRAKQRSDPGQFWTNFSSKCQTP